MNRRIEISLLVALTLVFSLNAATDNQALEKSGERASYFYLNPTKQEYEELQKEADRFAVAMEKLGNKSDVATAVELARISEKYNWDVSGKTKIADMARQIRNHQGNLAKYVDDDRLVDPGKLDIWWTSFFATGETKYLSKILKYAEPLQKHAKVTSDLMVAYAATWSFKSNCGQHKAVTAFAKQSLDSNAFPLKKDFLKECVAAPKRSGHYR